VHDLVEQVPQVRRRGCAGDGIGQRLGKVVADEQVEASVAIVVHEGGAVPIAPIPGPRRVGDVAESPAPHVFEEAVLRTPHHDVQIGVAVVVDVSEHGGHRGALRVADADAGALGDVFEGAVAPVSEEAVRVVAPARGHVEVDEPVAVHVRRRDGRAHRREPGHDVAQLVGEQALRVDVRHPGLTGALFEAQITRRRLAAAGAERVPPAR
jgi:hypothetical protein